MASFLLAEEEGFEPSKPLQTWQFSRLLESTTIRLLRLAAPTYINRYRSFRRDLSCHDSHPYFGYSSIFK